MERGSPVGLGGEKINTTRVRTGPGKKEPGSSQLLCRRHFCGEPVAGRVDQSLILEEPLLQETCSAPGSWLTVRIPRPPAGM